MVLQFEDFSNFILTEENDKNLINIEEHKKYADMQEEAKMQSLYSDLYDGRMEKPSDIINKKDCLLSIKLLEKRIRLFRSFEEEVASKINFKKNTKKTIDKFYKMIGLDKILKKLSLK